MNIGSGHDKTNQDERINKSVPHKNEKNFETKLCSRNLIKGINSWAVPRVRYSEQFQKSTWKELLIKGQENDNAEGHSYESEHRQNICAKNKEGREPVNIEDGMDVLLQVFSEYIKKEQRRNKSCNL